MLRGDVQSGGMAGGPHAGMGISAGAGDGNIAIVKLMKWHWAFFGGACLVTATGIGTAIHWIRTFTFAPATCFFELFLCTFGFIMLVLDTPVPHVQKHPHVQAVRFHIYKFALFMTRFWGRGVWYLFLATMVFGALWDTGINWFLGGACTLYLAVLGISAMVKGALMSHKLNRVRDRINEQGYAAERYVPGGSLSMSQFKLVVESNMADPNMFNDDELAYMINALSFSPYNEGQVKLEEIKYWLAPGPPLLV